MSTTLLEQVPAYISDSWNNLRQLPNEAHCAEMISRVTPDTVRKALIAGVALGIFPGALGGAGCGMLLALAAGITVLGNETRDVSSRIFDALDQDPRTWMERSLLDKANSYIATSWNNLSLMNDEDYVNIACSRVSQETAIKIMMIALILGVFVGVCAGAEMGVLFGIGTAVTVFGYETRTVISRAVDVANEALNLTQKIFGINVTWY